MNKVEIVDIDSPILDGEFDKFLHSKPMWLRMPSDAYHGGPGIGSSMLKTAHFKSMQHFHAGHVADDVTEEKESQALRMGTMCHLAILEGEKFKDMYVVEPEFWGLTTKGERTNSMNCKEVKEKRQRWLSDLAPGTVVVTKEERDTLVGMIEALLRHPVAAGLLAGGFPEVSGYAVCEETGLLMKMRADLLRDDGIIVDYKTTRDASPRWWPRQAATLGYHIQAGYYRRIANVINGTPKENRFVFIAQEKVAPYAVTVHVADTAFLERGEQIAMHALRKIKACYETNFWPGYSEEALSLSLPDWALKDFEEVMV